MISSRGLTNQAEIVLLSMDIPYRVINGDSENGTTSALFYGFKTNTTPRRACPTPVRCPMIRPTATPTANCPSRWRSRTRPAPTPFLAVMLTDTNLAQAESTLERGVASDSSFPPETVYLEKTSDSARNVRFVLFDNAIQECRARGDDSRDADQLRFHRVDRRAGTGYRPGTISRCQPTPSSQARWRMTLTSFGGYIFEDSGQTPLLAFLEAGACGSYGTVVEPCNYTYKFPDPMVYFYQNRGFCLAEAYYQSLANPYQGLIVGEPLSAPFARPGSAVWNSPADGSVLSGLAAFNLSFSAANTNLPLAQVDLFVDGTLRPDPHQPAAQRRQHSFRHHRRRHGQLHGGQRRFARFRRHRAGIRLDGAGERDRGAGGCGGRPLGAAVPKRGHARAARFPCRPARRLARRRP